MEEDSKLLLVDMKEEDEEEDEGGNEERVDWSSVGVSCLSYLKMDVTLERKWMLRRRNELVVAIVCELSVKKPEASVCSSKPSLIRVHSTTPVEITRRA